MFRNYIKIAIRNITKHSAYSVINIAGLSVGLTAFSYRFVDSTRIELLPVS